MKFVALPLTKQACRIRQTDGPGQNWVRYGSDHPPYSLEERSAQHEHF